MTWKISLKCTEIYFWPNPLLALTGNALRVLASTLSPGDIWCNTYCHSNRTVDVVCGTCTGHSRFIPEVMVGAYSDVGTLNSSPKLMGWEVTWHWALALYSIVLIAQWHNVASLGDVDHGFSFESANPTTPA